MSRDEIIRMAREVNLHLYGEAQEAGIERFFHAAYAAGVTAERSAILQMSREQWFKTQADFEEAIRARGKQG